MQVGSAQSNAVSLQAAAESTGSGEIAERWYGPTLALLTTAMILMSVARGYHPAADSHLAISLIVAVLLIIGGELFIISLPFSWGTAQVSVGAICGLGVAIWQSRR